MTKRHKIGIGLATIALATTGYMASHTGVPLVAQCDVALWNHVYAGNPRKYSKPQDRLKIIKDCVTVTGTIIRGKPEADGDFHVTIDLDAQFKSLLNSKNVSGQHGYLVVEPVCANNITQKDTLQEGVCDNFSQKIYNHTMDGKRVSVTGVYVTDMEHGWNEIHPVTSIIKIGN